MEAIWENHQLRQQLLDQLGNSDEGICFQFFHFKDQTFCFSNNICEITDAISGCSCTVEQWYQIIYEADRHRLHRYVENMFHIAEDGYSFNYRLRDKDGRLVWVTSTGKCTFDEQGNPKYFLGFLNVSQPQISHDNQSRQAAFLQELKTVCDQGQEGYLLMITVDNLRNINLKYGRKFGDGILQYLEKIMEDEYFEFSRPFPIGHNSFCTLATGVDRETVKSYFLN